MDEQATQAQTLRDTADWIESCNDDGNLMVRRFQRNSANRLRAKADQLENGEPSP